MTQRITVFGTDLDISDLKVAITFIGDQMVTAYQIQFETGPEDSDRDTLFATTIYTEILSFEGDVFNDALTSSIRTGSERYAEWLQSVGGVVRDSVTEGQTGAADPTVLR